MLRFLVYLIHFIVLTSFFSCKKNAIYPHIEEYEYYKVWSGASHNAFTDLAFFQNKFYLVCREGDGHVSPDGKVRILSSDDGYNFTSVHLISDAAFDLRDPKLIQRGDSILYVYYARTDRNNNLHQDDYGSISNGKFWKASSLINKSETNWMWNIINYNNLFYGVSYDYYKNNYNSLYTSSNIESLRKVSVLDTGVPASGENSLFILNDTLYSAIRQKHFSLKSFIGKTPLSNLNKWTFESQHPNDIVGGPKLFTLPDGNLYLTTRSLIQEAAVTALYRVDKNTLKLKYLFTLPSRGDNSYPGAVYRNGYLYLSYYSTFEKKAEIFVAKIPLNYIYKFK